MATEVSGIQPKIAGRCFPSVALNGVEGVELKYLFQNKPSLSENTAGRKG